MVFRLKRRCLVRIISFSLAAVIVLGGFWCKSEYRLTVARRQIAHNYQAALNELSTSIDSMALTLEKSQYVGTAAGLGTLADEIVLQAGTAGAALSALPVESEGASAISKFLSQVGDYFMVLSKKMTSGEKITEDERKNLANMAEIAADLSTHLEEARVVYDTYDSWDKVIKDTLSGAETLSGIGSSFTDMEESLSDTPELIYDGPFSDHILTRESKLLKIAEEINEVKAKEIAAKALQISADKLTAAGTEDGTMPSYLFKFDSGSIAITKQGGYVSYFRRDRDISLSQMSYEDAVEKAKTYVNSLGLGQFEESYYMTDEGICVVNFALKQGDTICYTDLIKVGIALDNGTVMLYEARGYIMNHSVRTFSKPKYTAEQAQEVLSGDLTVKACSLALIPSGGMNELHCYEFYCQGKADEEILVYVNTQTLAEENVMIVLKTDGGTLTK